MSNYIDAFVLPIPTEHLNDYKNVVVEVAKIWKEHGAIDYFEYVGEDLKLEGTQSFPECLGSNENESIIFGWVVFQSKEIRDLVNQKVAADPRMKELVDPLIDPSKIIFDAKRMLFGGFQSLVK